MATNQGSKRALPLALLEDILPIDRRLVLAALCIGLASVSASPAAADPLAGLDLTLRRANDPDTWIKPPCRSTTRGSSGAMPGPETTAS